MRTVLSYGTLMAVGCALLGGPAGEAIGQDAPQPKVTTNTFVIQGLH